MGCDWKCKPSKHFPLGLLFLNGICKSALTGKGIGEVYFQKTKSGGKNHGKDAEVSWENERGSRGETGERERRTLKTAMAVEQGSGRINFS